MVKQSGPDDFPDGGLRAWLVVLGTVCGTFVTFGYFAAWGVFQTYYEEVALPGRSSSDIAWIGSMQFSLSFMPGILTGRMFDLGYFKVPYFICSVLLVASTVLVAECTEYWHFLLCQGLATGGIYGPTMGCLAHYFKRRRGLALGFAAAGSGMGGIIFPIAARRLIENEKVGFKWTMRIIALILSFALVIGNLTLKRRLPPKNLNSGLINWSSFKSPAFSTYCIASFLAWHGLFTMLTYLDISATRVGIDPDFSFYLLSILNAGSLLGRLASGPLMDRFGCINTIGPLTMLSSIMTIAWPHIRTINGLIPVSIVYGFGSGAYVATFLGAVFDLGPVEEAGQRTGLVLTIGALGALAGPPTSGAIYEASGGYPALGGYAGAISFLGVFVMYITRYYVLGGKFIGKV
ncbi:MFS general substrate transporter [Pterulicium gracile]|uniref:MFS general substrate transporter n=1 Tax=Pterulicium gracile TaxID=1884261 RepID=A0A5C3Q6B0_9AGAR|nr:MFS general substrate transporter [Pterula gracilis]